MLLSQWTNYVAARLIHNTLSWAGLGSRGAPCGAAAAHCGEPAAPQPGDTPGRARPTEGRTRRSLAWWQCHVLGRRVAAPLDTWTRHGWGRRAGTGWHRAGGGTGQGV